MWGHGWNPALGVAADLQLAAALPLVPFVEFIGGSAYVDGILTEPFVVDADGYLAIPQRPGLGVQLDRERLARVTPDPGVCLLLEPIAERPSPPFGDGRDRKSNACKRYDGRGECGNSSIDRPVFFAFHGHCDQPIFARIAVRIRRSCRRVLAQARCPRPAVRRQVVGADRPDL